MALQSNIPLHCICSQNVTQGEDGPFKAYALFKIPSICAQFPRRLYLGEILCIYMI